VECLCDCCAYVRCVCVEFVCARSVCVRDLCVSVLLLLFGFRSAGMGVEVLVACFGVYYGSLLGGGFFWLFFVGIGRVSVF